MNNSSKQIQSKKSQAWLLAILGWIVYTTSYLGKLNYSANITEIIDFYGVTKAQAGIAPTFFFFAYGIGQVVNGLLCKRYNIKWTIFGSLFISALINLWIAVSSDFSMIKWLWLVNGFTLSMLWPTLIRLLSETLPQKILGMSSVIMGSAVAAGTFLIYGLSSIYVAFDKFKLAFYTASFTAIAVSVIWALFYNKAVTGAKDERQMEEIAEETKTETSEKENNKNEDKKIFFATIASLCFCAMGANLIKDGLTTWVPAILKEEFFVANSLSILLTLFLPVLAMFGNAYALKLHEKIPDYVNHCGVLYIVIAILVSAIIASLKFELMAFMLIGLVLVNFLASSLSSLTTSIFPLFMRGKVNSGLFAGIINGFCYLGSTISSYGLGLIADKFGWIYVFWTLIGFCVIAFIVWALYSRLKRVLNKKADKVVQ